VKTKIEIATEKFQAGFNCAQSVLFAFAPDLGLDTDTALKVSTGFGGGMARQGEVCGAVTGGIMVLGLKFGRGGQMDSPAKEQTYQKTLELTSRFEKRHGSCLCHELLHGCDLRVAEGKTRFKEQDLQHKICVGCVQTAVETVEELVATDQMKS
jgi:C_GCAxxG_C_C family probable redox protein